MTDHEPQPNPSPGVDDEDETEEGSFANNYALAIAMGLPLGMIFGLVVLDNISLGILIGAGLAPIIAAVMTRMKPGDQPFN